MPDAIWLIGPPGSGKSFFAKQYLDKNLDTVLISFDNLVEEWAEENELTYSEAFENSTEWKGMFKEEEIVSFSMFDFKMYLGEQVIIATRHNKNILVDMTNLRTRSFYALVSESKIYRKEAIIFEIDDNLLRQRLINRQKQTGKYVPDYVVNDMIQSYLPPEEKDFDTIRIIRQE